MKVKQVHSKIVRGNPNAVAHTADALDVLTITQTSNQISTFVRKPEISNSIRGTYQAFPGPDIGFYDYNKPWSRKCCSSA